MLSLLVGTVPVSFSQLLNILLSNDSSLESQVIQDIRWPRASTAFLTGGMLGLAGALMQILLRNPLADPYILGISGGAAVGALLALMIGLSSIWIDSAAFSGAIFSMLLVYFLSRSHHRDHTYHLLLTGVVLAAGWGAIINLLLILSNAQNVHSMLFWLMGDLSRSSSPGFLPWVTLLTCLSISWFLGRDLNLLSLGEHKAQTLGCPVRLVKNLVFIIAAICTAVAVSQAGTVGFIGLVIPHLVRLLVGSNHRLVLPASVLAGGSLLTLADLGARTLLSPQQLPVGVITAFFGVPVFLYLLKHRHTR